MTRPDLSIIIASYNVKQYLIDLIHSIIKYTEKIDYEIIVVDDCSTDHTMEELRRKFKSRKNIKVINNPENLGFARTNNQGINIAKGEFVLILNADTLITDNGLSHLVEIMRGDKTTGAVGCRVVYPDGQIQYTCARNRFNFWTNLFEQFYLNNLFPKSRIFGRELISWWDHESERDVDVLSGAFMLVRSDVLKKLDGFDPYFRSYFEDVDLCFKIKERGYRIRYIPRYKIIHFSGKSFSQLNERSLIENYISRYKFLKRYYHISPLILKMISIKGLLLKIIVLTLVLIFRYNKKAQKRLVAFSKVLGWHLKCFFSGLE
ncbi:MAG: glycosyltransferase family 2 protein [Spirochaetes bacterium]|nr:glycosyltransferase family 2 protein [Spirochaetota bacterium]